MSFTSTRGPVCRFLRFSGDRELCRKVKEHKRVCRKEKQCEYCAMKYKIGATRLVVWLQGSCSKCAYFDLIDVSVLPITTKCVTTRQNTTGRTIAKWYENDLTKLNESGTTRQRSERRQRVEYAKPVQHISLSLSNISSGSSFLSR